MPALSAWVEGTPEPSSALRMSSAKRAYLEACEPQPQREIALLDQQPHRRCLILVGKGASHEGWAASGPGSH